jgi:hypothetical protein
MDLRFACRQLLQQLCENAKPGVLLEVMVAVVLRSAARILYHALEMTLFLRHL